MRPTLEQINEALVTALSPSHLEVIDQSAQHHGHAGMQPGQYHLVVSVTADCLTGLPLVQAHRLIYAALTQWMNTHIHALKIDILP
jgi:BolA family transcriptional regulator, general stress-responsive regulator